MKRRNLILVVCVLIGGGLVVWWILQDSTIGGVALREERRRLWGYLGRPRNPFKLWCAEKVKAYDRKRSIGGENSLRFDGAAMCWGYSSPTSAWFAFGDNVSGSNLAYFEMALPLTQHVAAALQELPTLEFHGVELNYWAGRLGTNNIGFTSNTVGRAAIRLTTGSVLFVRHVEHPDTVHLLRLESIKEGLWSDVNVHFQRGIIARKTVTTPDRKQM